MVNPTVHMQGSTRSWGPSRDKEQSGRSADAFAAATAEGGGAIHAHRYFRTIEPVRPRPIAEIVLASCFSPPQARLSRRPSRAASRDADAVGRLDIGAHSVRTLVYRTRPFHPPLQRENSRRPRIRRGGIRQHHRRRGGKTRGALRGSPAGEAEGRIALGGIHCRDPRSKERRKCIIEVEAIGGVPVKGSFGEEEARIAAIGTSRASSSRMALAAISVAAAWSNRGEVREVGEGESCLRRLRFQSARRLRQGSPRFCP